MEFVLTLIEEAATVFIKTVVSGLAQQLISRIKGKTALTGNKDGSDINN